MRIDIMTLFPESVGDVLSDSILGRAQDRGIIRIETHQIRDYTANKQNQTDDYPYGGGRGAVMTADPLYRCWEAICEEAEGPVHTVYLSPCGHTFKQADAIRLSKMDNIVLVCGHNCATAAAIGIIVGLILLVGSIIPDLMGFNADNAPILGSAQNTFRQHITQRFREQRHNVNPHRCASLR